MELLQVFLMTPTLQNLAGGADPVADSLPAAQVKNVIDGMRASLMISTVLRADLNELSPRI